jgi:hypothetical protein
LARLPGVATLPVLTVWTVARRSREAGGNRRHLSQSHRTTPSHARQKSQGVSICALAPRDTPSHHQPVQNPYNEWVSAYKPRAYVLGAISQREREAISDRTSAAMRHMAAQGAYMEKCPSAIIFRKAASSPTSPSRLRFGPLATSPGACPSGLWRPAWRPGAT